MTERMLSVRSSAQYLEIINIILCSQWDTLISSYSWWGVECLFDLLPSALGLYSKQNCAGIWLPGFYEHPETQSDPLYCRRFVHSSGALPGPCSFCAEAGLAVYNWAPCGEKKIPWTLIQTWGGWSVGWNEEDTGKSGTHQLFVHQISFYDSKSKDNKKK